MFFIMAIIFAIQGWSQATLLDEGFEASTFPPSGWTRLTGLASDAFNGTAPTTYTAGWTRHTVLQGLAAYHARLNIFGTSCKHWLVTPSINLGSGTAYNLTFDLALTKYSGTPGTPVTGNMVDDKFMVIISLDNGATWADTNAFIWDNTGSSRVYNNIATMGEEVIISLAAYSGQIKIAFYGESTVTVSGEDNNLHIDNVKVGIPILCPKPTSFSVASGSITPYDASFNWIEQGSATYWEIQYKLNTDNTWDNATSYPVSDTNFAEINGLTPNTTYNARIRSICGAGSVEGIDVSEWSPVINFTTLPTCPAPVVSVSGATITQTEATVSWTSAITAQNYVLEYKENTASIWTSVVLQDTNAYTITGLTSNTPYNVRVYAICDADVDSSAYSTVVNFRTSCGSTTIPWTEDFEYATTYNTPDPYIPCYTLLPGNYMTPYNRTSYPHTGSKSLYFMNYGMSNNTIVSLPPFNVADIRTLRMTFWQRGGSGSAPNGIIVGVMTDPTDLSTFIQVADKRVAANAVYQKDTVDFNIPTLPQYAYITLRAVNGTTSTQLTSLDIDDIEISFIPLCPTAYNLQATVVSSTSINLSWSNNGNNTTDNYSLIYGNASTFDVDDNTTYTLVNVPVGNLSYALTSLTQNTTYKFAIRQNCGGEWSNIVTLATPQNAESLPYTTDFLTADWLMINGSQTNTWVIGNATGNGDNNSLYITNDGGTTNAYSGTTSKVYAYKDFSVASNVNELKLAFDWKGVGAASDYIRFFWMPIDVVVEDGQDPPAPYSVNNQIGGVLRGENNWQHQELFIDDIQFPNLAGNVWRLYIQWTNGSTVVNPPAAIDNLELKVSPCPTPANLAMDYSLGNNTLSWDALVVAEIQFMPASSNDWTTAQTITGVTSPYDLTLDPSTYYKIRVRSTCGATDGNSNWSQVLTTSTPCNIISTFPWTCGFEEEWVNPTGVGDKPSPYCWTVVNKGGTYSTREWWWKRATSGSHSGNGHASCYSSGITTLSGSVVGGNEMNDWLISPLISLTGNERLSFWVNSGNSVRGELEVYVSDAYITLDTSGMTSLGTLSGFTNKILDTVTENNNTWVKYTININQYSGYRYIAFVSRTGKRNIDGEYLRIDDVEISEMPTCLAPSQVTVNSMTQSSITVSWTPGTPSDGTWDIYYKSSSDATWNNVQATNNPYTLTGLDTNTTYQIYVVTDCGGSNVSEESNIVTATTVCSYISIPYSENFDGLSTGTLPECWVRNTTLTSPSYAPTLPTISNTYAYSGLNSLDMYQSFSGTSITSRVATILPPLDTSIDINVLRITFKMRSATSFTYPGIIVGVMTNPNDWTTFTPVGDTQYVTEVNTWQTATLSFANYPANLSNKYIVLAGLPSGVTTHMGRIYVDDIIIDSIPQCTTVENFNVALNIDNDVSVSWDTTYTSNSGWVLGYGEASTFDTSNTSSMTLISVTSNQMPYVITGLQTGVAYKVAMQENCGGTWTTPLTITVPDTIDLFINNYSEDFSNIPVSEWAFRSNKTDNWVTGSATGNPANSMYISSDGINNTYSTHNTYAYAYAYVQFSNAAEFTISFDWKCVGEFNSTTNYDYGRAYLLPANADLPLEAFPSGGLILGGDLVNSSTWQNASISLGSEYASTIKKLVFVWRADGNTIASQPLAIDNISITASDCVAPTDVVATINELSNTSVDVSWTSDGTAWIVYYKANDDATWTSVSTTNNPTTISGLNTSTTYNIYVVTDCQATGNVSGASAQVSYRTPCYTTAINTFPWTETFEATDAILCWAQEYVTNELNWTVVTTASSVPSTTEGTHYAFYSGSSTNHVTKLISPTLDLTSLTTPVLKYKHVSPAWGSDINALNVYYRTSSASSWVKIDSFSTNIATWQLDSIVLPDPSATYQIAFEGIDNWGRGVGLDSIAIYEGPVTVVLPVVTTGSTSTTSTSISFTGTFTEGTPAALDKGFVYSTTANVTLANGTSVAGNITGISMTGTASGLTAGTTYYFNAYARTATDTVYGTENNVTLPLPCDAPTNLQVTNTTSNSITITWDGGTATQWQVRVGNNPWGSIITTNTYTATNLVANQSYIIRVRTVCSGGTTYNPILGVATTASTNPEISVCAAPTDVDTVSVYATSADIAWTAGGSETQWAVHIGTNEYYTNSPSYHFDNLTPATPYAVEVRAICGSGDTSAYSSPALVFVTKDTVIIVLPDVTTGSGTAITPECTSAELTGTIINSGTPTATEFGFVYGTESGVSLSNATKEVATVNGNAMTATVTGLTSGTAYFFKAYAVTTTDTVYGAEETFSTCNGLLDVTTDGVSINIYPNPATELATLAVEGLTSDATVAITDLTGKIITTTNIRANQKTVTIDVKHLAAGVYYIRVLNNDISRTQKLIVNK
jgi:hypothetical protein